MAEEYELDDASRVIWEALRKAKPSGLNNLGSNVSGPRASALMDAGRGEIIRRQRSDVFPVEEILQQSVTTGFSPNISFLLKNASTSAGGITTNKVKVFDGKINGGFPSGMGFGNYVLTIGSPATTLMLIYAGVTFNPTTLDITSRFLGISTAAAYPESRTESPTSGFLYWQLGFTYIVPPNAFTIWQTKLGDINFALTYGAFNGKPALLPVDSEPGWLDLDFLP